MRKYLVAAFVVVCSLAPAAVFAGHPLVTDSASTIDPQRYEAETAVELASDYTDRFTIKETLSGGITGHLDAFISLPFSRLSEGDSSDSGFNDITVGVKWNLATADKVQLAVKPFLVLPVGNENKDLGEGGVGIGAVAIASLNLDKHISVDGNIGLSHQDTDNDSYNRFSMSVAGTLEATPQLKVVGELATSKTDENGTSAATILMAGVIYSIQKNVDLDTGLRFGLSSAAEDIALLTGFTYKF